MPLREQRLMREQRAAQIQLALHRLMQARFNVLRDDLAQDQLLGEILGADHDVVARAAGGRGAGWELGHRDASFDPTESSVRK